MVSRIEAQLTCVTPLFVCVTVVLLQAAADAVYNHHCHSVTCRLTDELVGYDELAEQCRHICADRHSFDIAIRELCRQKRCRLATGERGEKVAFTSFAFYYTFSI